MEASAPSRMMITALFESREKCFKFKLKKLVIEVWFHIIFEADLTLLIVYLRSKFMI